MIEILTELKVLGVNPIPVIMLLILMAGLRKNFLDKVLIKIKKKQYRWGVCTLIALVLAAMVTLPFILQDFNIYIYIQNVLITWVVSWITHDMIKRIFKDKE